MMKTRLVALFLVANLATILVGCASTPSEIRAPARQYSFTVAKGYQATYQKAYDRARACYAMNAVRADIMKDAIDASGRLEDYRLNVHI